MASAIGGNGQKRDYTQADLQCGALHMYSESSCWAQQHCVGPRYALWVLIACNLIQYLDAVLVTAFSITISKAHTVPYRPGAKVTEPTQYRPGSAPVLNRFHRGTAPVLAQYRDVPIDYTQADLQCGALHMYSESSCWAQQHCVGPRYALWVLIACNLIQYLDAVLVTAFSITISKAHTVPYRPGAKVTEPTQYRPGSAPVLNRFHRGTAPVLAQYRDVPM
ncbi:UNVERIFIED_CONTAM: hypothetical protein FKN15_012903 [Acipenser sinensis]